MTEKRFTIEIIEDKDVFIHQDGAMHFLGVNGYVNGGMVVDLLNNLYDENEQLKSRIKYLERKIERERNATQKQYDKWEKEALEKINELERIIKEKEAVIDEYHEESCEMEYKE